MTLYVERIGLASRGAVDPGPTLLVDGTLLVGTQNVLHYEANHSLYGNDDVYIFPAFHNGVRCWLKRSNWEAAYGYSASGTDESIISFEEGVALFLKAEVFKFPEVYP